MRGATRITAPLSVKYVYFNPRAPCGARPQQSQKSRVKAEISIHAPHAGRDHVVCDPLHLHIISIHAPHAGRDHIAFNAAHVVGISIHAPHAGRDRRRFNVGQARYISIHAPHAGRDSSRSTLRLAPEGFQSTRPMRGATFIFAAIPLHFSISIHAPHAGRDSHHNASPTATFEFQSTRPMRGATAKVNKLLCTFL